MSEAQDALDEMFGPAKATGSGNDTQAALDEMFPEQPARQVGAGEAFTRGIGQGGTLGFGDELAGAIMAVGTKLLTNDPDTFATLYKGYRDIGRAENQAARESSPKAYMAGELGGGAVTALSPVGAAKTFGGALASGAAFGAGTGLGNSGADLTEGDVGGAALDTAIGAGVGGVLGGAVHGVASGIRGVVNAIRSTPAQRAGQALAEDVATRAGGPTPLAPNAPATASQSLLKPGKSVAQAHAEGMAIQGDVSRTIGEPFQLRPSQTTGDAAAALAESKSAQTFESMNASQAAELQQLDQASRYLQAKVDWISKNPEKLATASEDLVKDLNRAVASRKASRSAEAKPFYTKARELLRGEPVDAENAVTVLKDEIESMGEGAGAEASAKLRQTLTALTKTEKHQPKFETLQSELSFWSQAGRSKGTALDQLGEANKRRIANGIREALQADLDAVAESGAGEGVDALRTANEIWKRHTKELDELGTASVQRIFKLGTQGAEDTAVARLAGMSPKQQTSVFRLLSEASPETASVVRAKLLEDVLVKGGLQRRGATVSAQEGVMTLSPMAAAKSLARSEPTLRAVYVGDDVAQQALTDSIKLLRRLEFGPRLKGSQTEPLAEVAITKAANAVAPQATMLWGWAKKILVSDKALAEAMSTREGIEAFQRALSMADKIKRGQKLTAAEIQGITRAASSVVVPETTSRGDE